MHEQGRYEAPPSASAVLFQQAIDAAAIFNKRYADNPLAPDVLAIEAESRVQLGKFPEAQATYAELLDKFAKHRDAPAWRTLRAPVSG